AASASHRPCSRGSGTKLVPCLLPAQRQQTEAGNCEQGHDTYALPPAITSRLESEDDLMRAGWNGHGSEQKICTVNGSGLTVYCTAPAGKPHIRQHEISGGCVTHFHFHAVGQILSNSCRARPMHWTRSREVECHGGTFE